MNDHYTEAEIALANEIANRLDDPAHLTQFLGFTKAVPHVLLRRFLDSACAYPEHRITSSRAAIFVNNVTKYMRFGHGSAGN